MAALSVWSGGFRASATGSHGSISAGQAQIASHRPEVTLWPGAVVQSLQRVLQRPALARAAMNSQASAPPLDFEQLVREHSGRIRCLSRTTPEGRVLEASP